ncbi:MAG: N-acetylneuraminate synthase family protein [Vicinamibacterales bacterium]
MVVVMQEGATDSQIEQVVKRLVEMGMDVHKSTGVTRTVLGAVGQGRPDPAIVEMMDGVDEVVRISSPYKLASRTFKAEPTIVTVGDIRIGGDEVIVMAGPCSAESEQQVHATAAAVRKAGAKILRGGAFKPRSSPYAFQGLGEEGLRLLRDAATAEHMALVSEVMDVSQIDLVERYCDIFQVGARNMQNFTLLRELGHRRKPVLLKRGISATIEEWLLSAEVHPERRQHRRRPVRARHPHVRDGDTQHVRRVGDRDGEEAESSAGRGRPEPRCGTARQGGADSHVPPSPPAVTVCIVEVHCDPDHALSDGAQSMFPAQFDRLMAELRIIAPAIGRSICLEATPRRGWGT